jgi:hypothetical protein
MSEEKDSLVIFKPKKWPNSKIMID